MTHGFTTPILTHTEDRNAKWRVHCFRTQSNANPFEYLLPDGLRVLALAKEMLGMWEKIEVQNKKAEDLRIIYISSDKTDFMVFSDRCLDLGFPQPTIKQTFGRFDNRVHIIFMEAD